MLSKYTLAILICLAHPFIAMEVTVFNVGQGNGTLTTVPGQPSLLIDLGSSQHPADKNNKSLKEKIIASVMEKIEASDSDELAIIASHPDIDHCNFLCEVAQKCLDKKYTLSVLLGGTRAAYEAKTKEDFAKKFKLLEQTCNKKNYPFTFCDETDDVQEFCAENLPSYCTIIEAQTGNKNPNDDSIIVRVEHDDFSALFLGDATQKVTDQLAADDIKSDVVIPSHHGAETQKEKCTTASLMKKTDPRHACLTSGMNGQYHHPRHQAVSTIASHMTKDINAVEAPAHCVNYYYGTDELPADKEAHDDIKAIIQYKDGFVTGLTCLSIYNTTNEGHITFSKESIERSKSSTAKNESARRTALNALQQSYDFKTKSYNFDAITRLNLSQLGLDDDILDEFKKLPPQLVECDLTGNEFTVSGIISLAKLLSKHTSKTTINLETRYEQADKKEDKILEKIEEKKIKKTSLNYRTLHSLSRLKNAKNQLITQARILFRSSSTKK